MDLAFEVVDWYALAPGLSDAQQWQVWAVAGDAIPQDAVIPKCRYLSMMTARRLNSGSRLAVECGMALLSQNQGVDALVFASRHGELERNFRILQAIADEQTPSPTDFTMSVHNAAVGSLSIAAKAPLPASSVAAGIDSFQQSLIEVQALLKSGYQQVLLVDFDGHLPDFYLPFLLETTPNYPYAVALVLQAGKRLKCCADMAEGDQDFLPDLLPQSLQFLRAYLLKQEHFAIVGEDVSWQWSVLADGSNA